MPSEENKAEGRKSAEDRFDTFKKAGGPFVAVAERTRMPLVFSDPDLPGNPIIYANDSFLALSGYDRDDVLGRNYHFLIGPCTDPAARAEIDAAFEEGYGAAYPEVCYHRKDGGTFWAIMFIGPVLNTNGEVVQHFASFLDITRRKRDEERTKHLLDELDHRVKNTLATVQAIARQSLSGSGVEERVRDAFEGRLLAMAQAHGLLARESWEGAGLREVVEQVLQPFGVSDGRKGRFSIGGGDVLLQPKAALALAMMFHELATNAAKHGALSNGAGHVDIAWRSEVRPEGERLRMRWRERGGPPVNPPDRKGFGSRLIERGLAHELHGEVRLAYEPDGVVCELVMPVSPRGGKTAP